MDIKELYSRFVEQENLPKDWKKQLYEALSSFVPGDLRTIDNISNMAHIVGGIIGGLLGYGLNVKMRFSRFNK